MIKACIYLQKQSFWESSVWELGGRIPVAHLVAALPVSWGTPILLPICQLGLNTVKLLGIMEAPLLGLAVAQTNEQSIKRMQMES